MLRVFRHSIFIIIVLIMCVTLLALIYKISRLEETNGRLRQIEREYNRICLRHGGNNCE